MQIQLLKYVGANNKINKRSGLSGRYTMDGYLRDKSSIIKPVFLMEKHTPVPDGDYNYMYIPAFKRFYFILDIIVVREDLWEIHGEVDVLYTYAEDIYNNKVIIDKSSEYEKSNLYLNDGSFVMDCRRYNNIKQFPIGLSEQGQNILICAGGA